MGWPAGLSVPSGRMVTWRRRRAARRTGRTSWRPSASPPGPGSRPRSPRRPPPRPAPGRRSPPAATRWWSPRPAPARRWRRSCGRSTGWPPTPPPEDKLHRCRVLYVSPLKALAVDVERNLRAPLAGIRQTADRLGVPAPDITVGVRSGDTTAADRRRLGTTPAGHPDHHARVAVPDAHLAGARVAARRRDGDRRRGARGRRHQARRPPRAVARAARRAARAARPSGSACPRPCARSTRSPASSAAPRPVEVVAPPSHQEVGPAGRRPGRGHDRARRSPRPSTRSRGLRRRQRRAPRLDLAARRGAGRRPDRAAPLDDRLRQLPPARRAADRPAQRDRRRARRRSSTRRRRTRPARGRRRR